MSCILSQIADISRLTIEPFPTNRQIRNARVVRCGRTLVAVDEKGVIYSNQVSAGLAYPSNCQLDETLQGVKRLGLLSPQALRQHEQIVNERRREHEHRYAAERILSSATTLGLKLTNAQKGRIERALGGSL